MTRTRLDLAEHVEHFRARVIQDALTEALAITWERRARDFERARPRVGEFRGKATTKEIAIRYRELTEIAEACRNHASLMLRSRGVACSCADDDLPDQRETATCMSHFEGRPA